MFFDSWGSGVGLAIHKTKGSALPYSFKLKEDL